MTKTRYQPLGPLLATAGSRAFLGLEISEDAPPHPVVLVWIPEEITENPEMVEKVARETQRAVQLDHPNIIRVHCLATLDEGMARVVEFADGESLRTILNAAQKLPPKLAALVIADACIGVHYAHLAGNEDGTPLVHGDVRPETLLVSFSGVCKVTGYGGLGVAPQEPGGRRVPGRRQHCAPEQLLSGREAANRQTDVYLLGAALYECLTGKIPFSEEEDLDLAVLNKPLPLPPPEEVPAELIRVLEVAMAKRAADRYPTTRALRDAIETAIGQFPAHEELSVFLKKFFPEDFPARVARRSEIDAGIAELSRKAPAPEPIQPSESAQSKRPPAESQQRRPTAQSSNRPPAPKSKLRRPAPETERIELNDPVLRPRRERSIAIYLVAGGILAGGALVWSLGRGPKKIQEPKDAAALVQPPAPANPRAGLEGQPKPRPTAPAIIPATAKETQTKLDLTVDPPVDVTLDGRGLGHSPVSAATTAGKHTVLLTNREKGINLSKSIRVEEHRTTSLRMLVGKAVLAITAPAGATIYIDGKLVGTAPLKEVSVYEGSHQISATVGGAKWQESFKVEASERMNFNIEAKAR
jgi:serine/threonine-protein kinase